MRRIALLLSIVVTFTLTPGGTANAGGWWSYLGPPGEHFGIGETVKVRDEVWFRTIEAAEKARTTAYYAYLVRRIDNKRLGWAMSRPQPRRWWTPPEWSVPIGTVELSRWDVNIAAATTHLEVPEVAPGMYHVMLCDAGCRTPLANVIPQRVRVTPEPLAAETARRLDRVAMRSDLRIRRLRKDLREANRQLVDVEAAAIESTRAIEQLQKEPSSPEPVTSPTPWWAFAGWFFAGAALVFAVTRSRRKQSNLPEEFPIEVPDEARELIPSR